MSPLGTVVGIFFGDELSCSGNIPFAVIDEATSFFRGALSAALGPVLAASVFYVMNECFSTFACVPPPDDHYPPCANAYNSTPMFAGYWPSIPEALDYISMDAYVGDGCIEPNFIRDFYQVCIFFQVCMFYQVLFCLDKFSSYRLYPV